MYRTRPWKRRLAVARATTRVGGNSSRSPTAAVTKPGMINRTPPAATSAPSMSSFVGMFPACNCLRMRVRTPNPATFVSHTPESESNSRSPTVFSAPITCATCTAT